jgi:pimeloyl-ACP methyl ester carboxylesterase
MSARGLCLLAIALAGLLTVPAGADAAPVPESFYTPAPGAMPSKHGLIMRSMRIRGGSLPTSGKSYLIMYSSKAPGGEIVPVTGLVTIPGGKPPKGGFPVVSWAHGTTGIADACAPSRFATSAPAADYVTNFRAEATHWVREGFAVAQTDYQGLGTPGMHPYLIGVSEGRSVVDIVLAARGLNRSVGTRWAAIGHSQGGHATLWAAALAKRYAPSLKLAGALPLAPASHIGEQSQFIEKIEGNPFGGLPALIIAAALESGGLDRDAALSDKALALYPQIEQVCLGDLSAQTSFGGLPLKEHFRAGYATAPLLKVVAANDPEDLTIRVPLLIAQGLSDTTVFPTYTDQMVADLKRRGAKLTYKTYDGVNHTSVVEASRADADAFLDKLLG